jgi:hypothetical protein
MHRRGAVILGITSAIVIPNVMKNRLFPNAGQ